MARPRSETASAPTGWSDHAAGQVRVLLECPPESSPELIAGLIGRRGYEVKVCEGPDDRKQCPLVHDGACALVDGADVVVNMLRRATPERAEVLASVAGQRRPPAVVAEVSASELSRTGDAPASDVPSGRVVVVRSPVTSESLFAAIGEALRRRDTPVPIWGDGFC